jgi:hypothetical protein
MVICDYTILLRENEDYGKQNCYGKIFGVEKEKHNLGTKCNNYIK